MNFLLFIKPHSVLTSFTHDNFFLVLVNDCFFIMLFYIKFIEYIDFFLILQFHHHIEKQMHPLNLELE